MKYDIFKPCLEKKSMDESEELVLNVIGFITNLSYYSSDSNVITRNQYDISKCGYPVGYNQK